MLASTALKSQLSPLTEEERSLARVGQGNLLQTAYYLENDPQDVQKFVAFLKGKTVLNRERFVASAMVENSEFSHEQFWSSRLEYPMRSWKDSLMELPRDELKKNWMDLNFARRNVDLMLAVSRALRLTYLGRLPREHGEPAPEFFSWRWHPQASELCLEGRNLKESNDSTLNEIMAAMTARGVCMENFRFHVSGSITPDP